MLNYQRVLSLNKVHHFSFFFLVFWDQISEFLCGKAITIPTIPFLWLVNIMPCHGCLMLLALGQPHSIYANHGAGI